MKRILLFVVTNFLVMIAFSLLWHVVSLVYPLDAVAGQYYGPLLVFFFIWGMGGAFVSLLISKWMAKRVYGVVTIDPRTSSGNERYLVEKVYDIARREGLREMPEVGIYESQEVNAFATGPSRKNSLVAVSSGLLQQMDSVEVEGVLAHEVAHVANGDMVTMTLIQGVINAFVLFFSRILADLVASQFEDEEGRGGGIFVRMGLNIFFQVIFGFLGMIVVAFFSRYREYRADLGAAKSVGKGPMIKALQRLQSMQERIEPDTGGLASLKIAAPTSWFSTHPSLEDRISRLERARM
ncbi:MAG: protease HtpX [Bdellovibrionales bacterium]|nr:protease HtpX [Bdellovibrionales bacterium]